MMFNDLNTIQILENFVFSQVDKIKKCPFCRLDSSLFRVYHNGLVKSAIFLSINIAKDCNIKCPSNIKIYLIIA